MITPDAKFYSTKEEKLKKDIYIFQLVYKCF